MKFDITKLKTRHKLNTDSDHNDPNKLLPGDIIDEWPVGGNRRISSDGQHNKKVQSYEIIGQLQPIKSTSGASYGYSYLAVPIDVKGNVTLVDNKHSLVL